MSRQKSAPRASSRPVRVGDLIQKELAAMLEDGTFKDPRIARASMVTVTGVSVSPDLQHAKAFVSIFPEDEEVRDAVLAGLNAAGRALRGEVGHRLRLRYAPEIRFAFDASIAYGDRIERVLKDVASEAAPGEPPEGPAE